MNKKYCESCGKELENNQKLCAECKKNKPKPFYKKPWFWGVIALVIIIIAAASSSDESSDNNSGSSGGSSTEKEVVKNKVTVVDLSKMSKDEISTWCEENKIECITNSNYSDTIKEGSFISQSEDVDSIIEEGDRITIIYSLGKKPTRGQLNALEQAKSYSDLMHMSKKRLYKQLTSEYGEGFTKEEAQYAIDHLEVDWKANALENAKTYQESLHMSKNRIYQQLISDYGEGFTKEEAQYAIDHLDD